MKLYTSNEPDFCWIEIKDVKVFIHLGVTPEESKIGHNICLDVSLNIPYKNTEDNIENTLDYGDFIELISTKIKQLNHVKLLEYLAEFIFEQIGLLYPKVRAAKIKIAKAYVPLKDFTGNVALFAEKVFQKNPSPRFGFWESNISAEATARPIKSFSDLCANQNGFYWIESRPEHPGKTILVGYDCTSKNVFDVTSVDEFNIKTSIIAYGGGALFVNSGCAYLFDKKDMNIYEINLSTKFKRKIISEGSPNCYFGSFAVCENHDWLYCIRNIINTKTAEEISEIVRISLKENTPSVIEVIEAGADFYSNVTLSKDGRLLSWLQWDELNMPWDNTQLYIATLDEHTGHLLSKKHIAGMGKYPHSESILQPCWSATNELYFCSDASGFWNIYKYSQNKITQVCNLNMDFGRPSWIHGTKCYAFINDTDLVACAVQQGIWKLFLINTQENKVTEIKTEDTTIQNIEANSQAILVQSGNALSPLSLAVSLRKEKQQQLTEEPERLNFNRIARSLQPLTIKNLISTPQTLCIPSKGGDTFAYFYPPCHSNYFPQHQQGSSALPPLIVKLHGGPTSASELLYNPKIQFYTSRGFAVLDLNYSGSSGYGKEYRNRLKKNWGEIDAFECFQAVNFLIESKRINKSFVFLTGNSAGGFTALHALAKYHTFAAASCCYPVCDITLHNAPIRKFEKRYTEGLVANPKENPELCKQRSPLFLASQIKKPVLIFHGAKDDVIPIGQSIALKKELTKNNVLCFLELLEEEGHGFCQQESIEFQLTKELNFFLSLML
ncbi:MAG: prolyl oligopeptidase family serine peptidase [Silvanigrellaceae bacterium]|nr:prolyl oligopeptidase family serine peptidase [Silvanigrellaceae bacterium]